MARVATLDLQAPDTWDDDLTPVEIDIEAHRIELLRLENLRKKAAAAAARLYRGLEVAGHHDPAGTKHTVELTEREMRALAAAVLASARDGGRR
jgi:hypothetical protein